jgi:hypothetical protein
VVWALSPFQTLATSGACASRWLPADSSALPAPPGDIWKQRVRGGAKNRNARRLPADAPAPREPTPVRPDLAHQLPMFQAALSSSRGETYLPQRGGMLRCGKVTVRCGGARARSMRWCYSPQGWQPGSHLRRPWSAVGLGKARARSDVGARRGHHGAAAVTSSLARPHWRGIASPCWSPWRMGTERCQRRMGGESAGGRSQACSGPRGK